MENDIITTICVDYEEFVALDTAKNGKHFFLHTACHKLYKTKMEIIIAGGFRMT